MYIMYVISGVYVHGQNHRAVWCFFIWIKLRIGSGVESHFGIPTSLPVYIHYLQVQGMHTVPINNVRPRL